MDQCIARWSQIVWMDREELESLQRREILRATRGIDGRLSFVAKNQSHWMDLDRIKMSTMSHSPDGYWPRDMSTSEQAASMAQFEARIYPLWRGIAERDTAAEALMTTEQVREQRVLLECITLHKQDLAIFNSGIKPNRTGSDYTRMIELRRKAAKASRTS